MERMSGPQYSTASTRQKMCSVVVVIMSPGEETKTAHPNPLIHNIVGTEQTAVAGTVLNTRCLPLAPA